MKSISTFINLEGFTSTLKEDGIIRVYTHNPNTNSWEVTKEFEFTLSQSTSISAVRSEILSMVQKIGDCRIFAAREVAGQLYSVLEANGFNVYETEGKPEQFLDSIWASEEKENRNSPEKTGPHASTDPKETDVPGTYSINLKAVLNTNPNLTSKKILLPFLASRNFKVLKVICDHVPKWFDDEFEKQGLHSTVSKLDENEYKVVISI